MPGQARLATWLKTLPQHTLPIDAHVAKQLLQLLKQDDCNVIKLATLVKHDPILCLQLFHDTERVLQDRGGDIQHIAHLLSLIGLNKLEQTIKRSKCSHTQPDGLKELLSASQFTAYLSNTLLARKHGASNERFFLPCLFFNTPLWMMWVAAPKTAAHSQQLASQQPHAYLDTYQRSLGFSLDRLLKKAHTFVQLPASTYKALAMTPQDNLHFWAKVLTYNTDRFRQWMSSDKAAKHYFNSVEMGIYLMNQYTIAVYFDQHGKHRQRFHTLLCRYLNKEAGELHTEIIEQANNIELATDTKEHLTPLYRLQQWHITPEMHSETAATPRKKNATHVPAKHPHIPEKIKQWRQKIRSSRSTDNALNTTLAALSTGVGVEHCIIMRIDDNTISTQAHYGFTPDSPIRLFEHSHKKDQTLFDQLIQNPACIAIRSQDLAKAATKIPKPFTQHCPLQPCGLLSIFQHKQPKVLIYCDQPQWDPKTHHYFKVIGHSLSQTLQQLRQS